MVNQMMFRPFQESIELHNTSLKTDEDVGEGPNKSNSEKLKIITGDGLTLC
jgi:hypothetical protein